MYKTITIILDIVKGLNPLSGFFFSSVCDPVGAKVEDFPPHLLLRLIPVKIWITPHFLSLMTMASKSTKDRSSQEET